MMGKVSPPKKKSAVRHALFFWFLVPWRWGQ